VEACRESGGGAPDLIVGLAAAAEPIVVHEELAARAGEVAEEVDERVAGHE
jgi:hypothetical protein